MQASDRSIVVRDQALPGLGLLLEPAALLAALRTAWPAHDLSEPELIYLRYKPWTNCLVAYSLFVDGDLTFVHATAHRADDKDKSLKALEKFRGESPLKPVILPQNIIVRAFPTDRKLAALELLSRRPARRKLLQKALPEHPELWDADLNILRYKPERRLVARLVAPDGSQALLKLYHDGDFKRARAGAEAFSRGALLSAPLLGIHPRHRVLVWRWLDAAPCDALLGENPEVAEAVGRTLAILHAQPAAGLTPVTRAEESSPLKAAALHVAWLLPELAARVERLADGLDTRLCAAPPRQIPVHGDFSADQALRTPAGMAIIDFDAAALGDPAWDFGTFMAQLERGAIRGDIGAETVSAIQDALQAGYQAEGAALPPRIGLYTAAGLLRLAPHAFRTRRSDWPEETARLIERAEELLGSDVPVLRGSTELHEDPGLRFAAGALEPTLIGPHLNELFGPHTLRRAELRRHKPGRRAIVGYDLELANGELRVLGKVRAKGTDTKTHALQTFLWQNGFDDRSDDGVSVAEPLGVLAPFHMTLQRAMPGSNLEALLTRPDAEGLMRRVAEAAYKLHRTHVPTKRTHTVKDELTILRRQLKGAASSKPQHKERLTQLISACERLAAGLPEGGSATLHRDFYPEQLLVDGERLYLLDLDLSAQGDPALDIGNFAAHLREYALRVLGNADALEGLEDALIHRYHELSGVPPQRVAAYAALSLARHIAVSGRIPARRHLSETLLALSEARLELSLGIAAA